MTSSPPSLTIATDRLCQRTDVTARRLEQRIQSIADAHDLKASELRRTHREIKGMHAQGIAPSPSEYWETTAYPWASVLVSTCIAAIDDELRDCADAVERFQESVRIINRTSEERIEAGTVRQILEAELKPLLTCAPSGDELNSLATRWSQQLRRSAHLRSIPVLLFRSAAEADRVVGRRQVDLVEEAPWAHTDRLLSAFELGHADIRTHLTDSVAALSVLSPVAPTAKTAATLAHS